jgi:hypothetical protein
MFVRPFTTFVILIFFMMKNSRKIFDDFLQFHIQSFHLSMICEIFEQDGKLTKIDEKLMKIDENDEGNVSINELF